MNRQQYLCNVRIIMIILFVSILICLFNATGIHAAGAGLSITSVSAQAPTASTTRAYDVTLNDGSTLTLDVPVLQVKKPMVGPCEKGQGGGFLGFFTHPVLIQNGVSFDIR